MSTRNSAQELLERRAAELARPVASQADLDAFDVVVVRVAGERRYAFEAGHVRRVVRNTGLCRLPADSGQLLGLVLDNGDAVPVSDLAAVLGVGAPDRARPFVLLLAGSHLPLGLLVDEVESSRRLTWAELTPTAETNGTDPLERGITTDGVVLVDAALLLADDRPAGPTGAPTGGARDLPELKPSPQPPLQPPLQPGEPCPR